MHQLWHRLTEAVARVSPFTKSYLLEAHPVSFARNVFIIGFDPEFEDHIGLVDNAKNHTLLQTKLSELGHPNAQIKFIKAEQPAGWAQRAAGSRAGTGENGTRSHASTKSGVRQPQLRGQRKARFNAVQQRRFQE